VQPSQNAIFWFGKTTRLEPKMVEVLVCLAEHAGETVSKEQLIRKVWGDTFVTDDVLTRCISELRRVMEDDAKEPRVIQTIPKRGYRLIMPVHPLVVTQPAEEAAPVRRVGPFGISRGRIARWGLPLALLAFLGLAMGLNLAGVRDWLLGRPLASEITSIAVLPLQNLSGDSEQEYLADGMTETLIAQLAKISALRVISRTSVMRYKRTNKALPEIARELGADALIEGSVTRSGSRIRITAQLIYAPSDKHLWGESYERDLSDVLVLQSEVARTIAHEINIKLTPQDQTRLATARPVNSEAYELYLKGRYYWNKMSGVAVTRAAEYFSKAIALDGSYAPVYVGLADCYVSQADLGHLPPSEAYGRAKTATLRALEIDNGLAEAHASLAVIRADYDWDWEGAETEFQRALELDPKYREHGREDKKESWSAHGRHLILMCFSHLKHWESRSTPAA
jgi:TolB-like protein/DNA-binding winged helix-turn-helix (wHTH) protein